MHTKHRSRSYRERERERERERAEEKEKHCYLVDCFWNVYAPAHLVCSSEMAEVSLVVKYLMEERKIELTERSDCGRT